MPYLKDVLARLPTHPNPHRRVAAAPLAASLSKRRNPKRLLPSERQDAFAERILSHFFCAICSPLVAPAPSPHPTVHHLHPSRDHSTHQCTATYIISSWVVVFGSISATICPLLATRILSDTSSISGRYDDITITAFPSSANSRINL